MSKPGYFPQCVDCINAELDRRLCTQCYNAFHFTLIPSGDESERSMTLAEFRDFLGDYDEQD
jgi:hypothetical protein